jgi:hypothetical protein
MNKIKWDQAGSKFQSLLGRVLCITLNQPAICHRSCNVTHCLIFKFIAFYAIGVNFIICIDMRRTALKVRETLAEVEILTRYTEIPGDV